MLVIKGQMELKECTMQWKQKGHVMVSFISEITFTRILMFNSFLDLLARIG